MDFTLFHAGHTGAREFEKLIGGEPLSTVLCEFDGEDPEVSVSGSGNSELLLKKFFANPCQADRAFIIYPGVLEDSNDAKVDAMMVRAIVYQNPDANILAGLTYRPPNHPDGFALHRLTFSGDSSSAGSLETLTDAFFQGFDGHDEAFWDRYFVEDPREY